MAISIRGTFTRPNVDTVWAMHIFYDAVVENISIFNDTGKISTYMKGNPATDLTLVVDHYFTDEAFFAEYKDTAYQHIPSWGSAANMSEMTAYQEENGLTLTLEEVSNPDLTGYTAIEEVTPPDNLTL
jgi:hypothetical protein